MLLSRCRLWLMAGFFGLALVLAAFGMASAQAHGPGTVPPSADCHEEDADSECELQGRVDWIRNAEGGPIVSIKQHDFQIVPATEVENGPVEVDDCVEITFIYADVEVHPLEEISVKSDDDCRKDDESDDDEAEFRGRVESFERREDGTGSIVVDNGRTAPQSFLIDQATEFDDDYGMPGEGDCVEVEYDPTTDPPLATEIETKREHHCRGDDGGSGPGDDDRDGEGRLYGTLQSINAAGDLWLISGVSFVVNDETELEPKGDGFDPGDLVKVEFHIVTNAEQGTTQFIAEEIEEKYHREDNGRDDDGDGAYQGVEGKAEGPLESAAETLWTVGGIDFVVTGTTEFEDGSRNAPPSFGTFVEVKFFLNAEGAREAIEISTEDDDNDGYWELVGFVTSQPEQRFLGEWGIANVTFVADERTDFEEGRGLLAVGAFVKVEYYVENEGKYIHEIEVHVPPGAGDRNRVGRLERRGAETAAAGVAAVSYWMIDDQTYLVNEATRLNDRMAGLVEGATVAVNSYTDADGTEVATSITGLQLDSTLFLPLIVR
jgi:hypothetical protein